MTLKTQKDVLDKILAEDKVEPIEYERNLDVDWAGMCLIENAFAMVRNEAITTIKELRSGTNPEAEKLLDSAEEYIGADKILKFIFNIDEGDLK